MLVLSFPHYLILSLFIYLSLISSLSADTTISANCLDDVCSNKDVFGLTRPSSSPGPLLIPRPYEIGTSTGPLTNIIHLLIDPSAE